jgi:predicted acyltransferase
MAVKYLILKNNNGVMEKQRLYALDVFRGFTIIAMLTVNYPGNWSHVFAPLLHKDWHGVTPTDLIYPFFLFIVGVSIYYAYSTRLSAGITATDVYKKILIRTVKIFGLGIFLNLYPEFNFSEVRIAGVLQRIALVFLFCSVLFINTSWKTQLKVGIGILVGYCILMMWIPTPGFNTPMLEPGKNLAAWVDSKFLPGKMWQGTWDPEGILSTFPAFVNTIAGMLVGKLIGHSALETDNLIKIIVYGFTACVIGVIWHYYFPINKQIWSSSYVMITSGLSTIVLSICLYLFDFKKQKKWTFASAVFGNNAIAAYFLAGILSPIFYGLTVGGKSLNTHFFDGLTNLGLKSEIVSLMYALMYVGIIFVPIYILYKKKIFIKL